MKKPQPRFKPFLYARQRQENEVPWVRVGDFEKLHLPRPVVLVNGCFDILHAGHMRLLFAAKEKAKTLVVAIDGDEMVRQKKGPNRPILNWVERATVMNYMPVDFVVEIQTDEEFKNLMRCLKPDLRVCGMDRAEEKTRFQTPRMFIREGALHTSDIIKRVEETLKKEKN